MSYSLCVHDDKARFQLDTHWQADETLFNVHRYWFKRDSPAFRAMFSMPPPPGQDAEGTSDENAIRLAVSALDFERFLSILYPPCACMQGFRMLRD